MPEFKIFNEPKDEVYFKLEYNPENNVSLYVVNEKRNKRCCILTIEDGKITLHRNVIPDIGLELDGVGRVGIIYN